VIYVLRLPRALYVAVVIGLGGLVFSGLLALNAFYFTLTSRSNREAYERIEAAADRWHRSRR